MFVIGMCLLLTALLLMGAGIWLRRSGKNQPVIWVLAVLMLVGSGIWSFVIHDLRYDLRMRSALEQFEALPLPAATMRSETESEFGLIFANSNHCDYFIGSLLRSELSLEQLKKHYARFEIKSPLQADHPDHPHVSTWQENAESLPVPYALRQAGSWKLRPQATSKDRLYLLSVSDAGYPPKDMRCH